MASGYIKLLENFDRVCIEGSHGGLLRPNLMLSEDKLQIPVCFIRNWVGAILMRERGNLVSYF